MSGRKTQLAKADEGGLPNLLKPGLGCLLSGEVNQPLADLFGHTRHTAATSSSSSMPNPA